MEDTEDTLLSSKEVLERTGISRTTLNNYIALALLPKPLVTTAMEDGRSVPRLGHFPASVIDDIRRIIALKGEGKRMADIVSVMGARSAPRATAPASAPGSGSAPAPLPGSGSKSAPSSGEEDRAGSGADISPPGPGFGSPISDIENRGLRLSLDHIDGPAYMVNSRFELEWCNDEAMRVLFGPDQRLSSDIRERKLFNLFLEGRQAVRADSYQQLLRFHLSIAKKRLSKTAILDLESIDPECADPATLFGIYDAIASDEIGRQDHMQLNLSPRGEKECWYDIHASFFREGVFFAYSSTVAENDELLALLSRRDIVIRDLLKRRRPYLTDLAVLVADLQSSMKICAELPPEEYFRLINDVWQTMEPRLRKYQATHGKHVGDGLVCYFFPQPDSDYVMNALSCALEMKEAMREVSRQWRQQKNWLNDLVLNIGMDEGQEWFGTYQTPTHVEFTVLGDTINKAGRLSDLARNGAVCATKNMVGKLDGRDRQKVHYGVRREGADGGELLVPETFSRVSNLVDLDDPINEKFKDIAVLPITEILDLQRPAR